MKANETAVVPVIWKEGVFIMQIKRRTQFDYGYEHIQGNNRMIFPNVRRSFEYRDPSGRRIHGYWSWSLCCKRLLFLKKLEMWCY